MVLTEPFLIHRCCLVYTVERRRATVTKISALGRPILLNCTTNRVIVYFTLTVFAAVFLYQLVLTAPFMEALSVSASAALAVFLTWAISREIDPAHDWSAFAGLPFTLAAALLYGSPALITLFFLLLFSRLINGTTGLRATLFDAVMLTVLAVLLFTNSVFIGLPLLALGFGFEALTIPGNRNKAYFAVPSIILFLVLISFFVPDHYYVAGYNLYTGAVALVIIFLSIFLMVRAKKSRVKADHGAQVLDNRRILLAQAALACFIIIELYLKGNIVLVMLYPVLFAYLGTAVYNLVRRSDCFG